MLWFVQNQKLGVFHSWGFQCRLKFAPILSHKGPKSMTRPKKMYWNVEICYFVKSLNSSISKFSSSGQKGPSGHKWPKSFKNPKELKMYKNVFFLFLSVSSKFFTRNYMLLYSNSSVQVKNYFKCWATNDPKVWKSQQNWNNTCKMIPF